MTKEEIIEMAEKCGIKLITDEDGHIGFLPRKIYDFAKLIAEKEREECAKLCENSVEYAGDTLAEAIRSRMKK